MTAPAIFDYSGQQVRTVLIGGEPWFVASDVCRILEHTNPTAATGGLDTDERGLSIVETPSGAQQMVCVSEAGLFSLILRSRKPEARAFRRWVTHELLPQIRRTGSFGAPTFDLANRDHVALIVQAGNAALERAVAAEAKVAELEPAAEAWTALADAVGDYSLREAAEILCRDERIRTGQNLLLKYLRQVGWVDRNGIPYQAQINTGRLAVRTRTYDDPYTGEPHITTQVRVTAKGVDALHKLMTAPAGLRALPGGAA